MLHNEMLTCIEACTYCHSVCLHTFEHCLNKGGRHAEPDHIRTLIDCAQICATRCRICARAAPSAKRVLGVES